MSPHLFFFFSMGRIKFPSFITYLSIFLNLLIALFLLWSSILVYKYTATCLSFIRWWSPTSDVLVNCVSWGKTKKSLICVMCAASHPVNAPNMADFNWLTTFLNTSLPQTARSCFHLPWYTSNCGTYVFKMEVVPAAALLWPHFDPQITHPSWSQCSVQGPNAEWRDIGWRLLERKFLSVENLYKEKLQLDK